MYYVFVRVWLVWGLRERERGYTDSAVWLPQVLALALAGSFPDAQQPAETRHRASSAWRECTSKIARGARGGKAGNRALLLFAVGALLPRGVPASEAGICMIAICLGSQHTCAKMVRQYSRPLRLVIFYKGGRPISGVYQIPAFCITLLYCMR